jgi:YfiH family protein
MPFQERNGLRFFTFGSFDKAGINHAIFTRRGGVSAAPYAELNTGATVGDERAHVLENLQRLFAAAERPRDSIFDSWLVHGSDVLVSQAPRPVEWARPPKADIVITNKPGVTLFMRYADCVPILLYDPRARAAALAHAGWRGTVAKVAARAVRALSQEYGSMPQDLLAAIGPAICARHYEVGGEVVEQVRAAFGPEADGLLPQHEGSTHLDLVEANRLTLQTSGVVEVELANLCTAEHTDDWFSHRASGGRTGRFGALICVGDHA